MEAYCEGVGKGMPDSRSRYHIYVVEDENDLLEQLQNAFEVEGFDVTPFSDGPPMLRYVKEHGVPHLAIIDLGLPSMHGFDVSAELRESGDVPIIFISSIDDVETRIEGLRRFSDDYIVKPFEARELVTRVSRVLSRIIDLSYGQSSIVRIDARLAIDFGNSRLLIEDRIIPLTPTESSLLLILLRNRGRAVSSETLIARVWPFEIVYEETLRVHVHRLRRKVEQDHRAPRYILTERGMGYRFVD